MTLATTCHRLNAAMMMIANSAVGSSSDEYRIYGCYWPLLSG